MSGDMLTAARRDPDFRGIDPDALGRLVQQVVDAGNAVQGWLNSHQPPPGVSASGYASAALVSNWVGQQLGMLTRRRNFALSHPDRVRGVPRTRVPARRRPITRITAVPTDRPPRPLPHLVHVGAGGLGSYPSTGAATRAAGADARAIRAAVQAHRPIPPDVLHRIAVDRGDPDYARALVERLGPDGVAALIAAAGSDRPRLAVIEQVLATASTQFAITRAWLSALLTQATALGDRAAVIKVLEGTAFDPRATRALAKVLGTAELPGSPS